MNSEQNNPLKNQKEQIKQQFELITDSDISFGPGEKEEMIERLLKRLDKNNTDWQKTIEGFK